MIVADEPVLAFDVSVRASILNLLQRLQATQGLGCLFITHDLGTAEYLADQVAVMHRGQIVGQGPCERVFTNPRPPYTQALLDATPVPDPRKRPSHDRGLPQAPYPRELKAS